MNRSQLAELARFGVVGGAATIVHFGVVAVLLEISRLSALAIHLTAYGAAFSVSFFGHYHVTFRSQRTYQAALVRFIVVSIGVVTASSAVVILLDTLGVTRAVASLIAAALVPFLNYILGKFVVF